MLISWLKKRRVTLINSSLLFLFFLINVAHYIAPVFEIPFYKSSQDFIWLLSKRVDLLLLIFIFYIHTVEPRQFKNMLIGFSVIVFVSILEILPFEDRGISFYLWSLFGSISFGFIWIGISIVDKIDGRLEHNRTLLLTKYHLARTYINLSKSTVESKIHTPEEKIGIIKDVYEQLTEEERLL